MHILFLSDNFSPEVNAPASRTFEHCRQWVHHGHRVTVITCVPNFPNGKVFPGYRNRLYQRETMEGIEVIRVWSYITANQGFLKRTLDYLSFMISAIFAAPFVRRVDLVVATSPQFFTACAGYVTSRFARKPFVFELRDLWPESIRVVGAMKHHGLLASLEKLELFLYRKAAAIVSVTNAFRDNLISRGIDREKIFVVTNGADLSRFSPRPRDTELAVKFGLTGKFVVGYVGTLGLAHGLEIILDAARELAKNPDGADVQFVLLGDGASKAALKMRSESLELTSVHFLDTVPKEEVPRYWSLLDASLIHLRRVDLFNTVIPSKLFESMAMGIPILHGVAGESARIVEAEGAGIVFEAENSAALVESILKLKNASVHAAMAEKARSGAIGYDRSILAERMLEILERLHVNAVKPATSEIPVSK